MAINILMPIRAVQMVFAIIILGLSASVANWWTGYWHSWFPSEINFIVFSSVWTILALIYLVLAPLRFERYAHNFAILAVEGVTMIFWFAGFIALAVFLTDRTCYGSVCATLQAACVFAAFEWALFVATMTLSLLEVLRARGGRSSKPSIVGTGIHQGV